VRCCEQAAACIILGTANLELVNGLTCSGGLYIAPGASLTIDGSGTLALNRITGRCLIVGGGEGGGLLSYHTRPKLEPLSSCVGGQVVL
jgi:hypothetical protein